MKRNTRRRRIALLSLAAVAVAAVAIVVTVLGQTGGITFTATPYSNLVRFSADGAATLQVQVFDLSGKRLWDSGIVAGWSVDWSRTTDSGQALAFGVYLYSAKGWSAGGGLVLQKQGKIALLPGDKVQLQAAPKPTPSPPSVQDDLGFPERNEPSALQPLAANLGDPDAKVLGRLGVGLDPITVAAINGGGTSSDRVRFRIFNGDGSSSGTSFAFASATGVNWEMGTGFGASPTAKDFFIADNDNPGHVALYISTAPGNRVGIGTADPSATLEVHGSDANLLALYDPADPSSPKFKVTKAGAVYADGSYYGANYLTGSADVAERINTSEWVDKGDVVEIDSAHPGFFCKTTSPYSTKVAGVISTSPGVILGNSGGANGDQWDDNRPVLAITGRVPVHVTTENGPIHVGDLLVSSSTPGCAMRCGDPAKAVGTVIGKAMEPLEQGEGTITVQVMLR